MAVVMSAQPEIDDHIAFSSARSQLSTSESRASNEVRKADPVEEHEESESAPSCGSSEETMVWHWVLRLLRRRDESILSMGAAAGAAKQPANRVESISIWYHRRRQHKQKSHAMVRCERPEIRG